MKIYLVGVQQWNDHGRYERSKVFINRDGCNHLQQQNEAERKNFEVKKKSNFILWRNH